MENLMTIAVWVIAIIISFVPMSFTYKIMGIIVSIILIALVTYLLKRSNRLSTMTLVINLLIIGWDLATVYFALAQ